MDFTDKVVLITGASSGIGQRLAIDLSARGAIVIGCGRSSERLKDSLAEIQRASPSSTMIACDVGDPQQVRAMVSKVLGDFGKIDVLVNNAGVGMRRPFIETSLEIIEGMIRTNYLGAVYCTKEALPSMVKRGSGHIVNISSGAGKIGTLSMAGYCASKFAMNGLSESLYHELKPLGIRVTVICPGPVRTDFNRSFADIPPKSPSYLVVSTESVSKAVIKAIERKNFEVVVPSWLALVCFFKRIMPNLFRTVLHRTFRHHIDARRTHGA